MAWALLALSAGAQPPGAIMVEPGSKGPLPEVAPVPGFTEPNRFGALHVSSTLGRDTWYEDRGHYGVELTWWDPASQGADYYTLQYRYGTSGEWQTQTDGNGNTVHYDNQSLGTFFRAYSGQTLQFRLKMNGGSRDGYLSNEVTAKVPSIFCAYAGYSESTELWLNVVGQKLDVDYNVSVRAWDANLEKYVEYNTEDKVYNYAWFRVNPTTWDETRIEGATEPTYTPTLEDVGYWLYCEISGDGEHCDFVYRYLACPSNPLVCVPVQASPAYFGPDGFVLNTDYILPTPGQDLFTQWYEYDETTQTSQEMMGAVGPRLDVRQPGQYAVRMTEDEYMYNMVILSPNRSAQGYVLTFVYNHDKWSEELQDYVPNLWYRECQLMADRYAAPLDVKPVFDGQSVPTTVDIVGPDIDGNLVVKVSATWENCPEDGAIHFESVSNLTGCYVKARATANTLETYYPSALFWTEATLVKPEYDEDWNIPTVTIDVKPVPEPLAGSGTITGTVATGEDNVRAWVSLTDDETNDGTATGYSVYLRVKGGDIVAQTTTDAAGNYRFDNVPFGTYEILVNIDGCTMEQPAEVNLSAENPVASDVDYTVSGTEILPTSIQPVALPSDQSKDFFDLCGRRLTQPIQHGIYIRNGKKLMVR